jgi:hypothetical protein
MRGLRALMQGNYAVDLIRIILMFLYWLFAVELFIRWEYFEVTIDLYAVMNLMSWITIMVKYFRFFDKLSVLVLLVETSAMAMVWFTIIIAVIMGGFATSLNYKA